MISEYNSIQQLKEGMKSNGAYRLYVKHLAPNDNSKNQVYLGGNFDVLNILPFGKIETYTDRKYSKRDRLKAPLDFYWLDGGGRIEHATGAQLILYPKYPEVRMSGFLIHCKNAPSEYMRSRNEGRLLFLGIRSDGRIVGHVCGPENPVRRELENTNLSEAGILSEISLDDEKDIGNDREDLLNKLREINNRGWLTSMRLNSSGEEVPCLSSHCGGYTLEALLGITPNGYAQPDYKGWEIKQHGVSDFERPNSGGPITLMTPEPTGGYYKNQGVEAFIRKYGYEDRRGKEDRLNFGGIYKVQKTTEITGLTTVLNGYTPESNKLDDIAGGLRMVDANDNIAAEWSFSALLELWNRKHAKAVFVPSMMQKIPERQYHFGHIIELGVGTDFFRFLNAMVGGEVYLDPALKLENASTKKPKIKRRNQFRIKPSSLNNLYDSFTRINLNEVK